MQLNRQQTLQQWIGVEIDAVSWKEKFISMAGGFVAILMIVAISQNVLHLSGSAMLIASMGASAVLLFAVPHGQLSQPWPVIAGHGFSALIGVICASTISNVPVAAGCAVGLSIFMMHHLKCIHPPGGATALTAVTGGPHVKELGYSFVWSPVVMNALVIVTVAVAFNYIFKWRRYPAFFNQRPSENEEKSDISHEEVVEALRSLDSFVDITEEDLVRLSRLLTKNHEGRLLEKSA